jgi:hypothetical protein
LLLLLLLGLAMNSIFVQAMVEAAAPEEEAATAAVVFASVSKVDICALVVYNTFSYMSQINRFVCV